MARTATEVFIRPVKKSEKYKTKHHALAAIPSKAGYRKVYKPYGSKGAGFYYVRGA